MAHLLPAIAACVIFLGAYVLIATEKWVTRTAAPLGGAGCDADRNELARSSNSSRRHPRTRSGAPQADSPSCGRVSGMTCAAALADPTRRSS